ncbi:dihydrodipicolinate synthase family protein [Candidatus Hodarchaeum mangrovi]
MQRFQVAIITPFKIDGTIDYDYFGLFLPLLEKNNVDTVIAFATNGEGPSLSLQEVEKALRAVLDSSGNMEVFMGVFQTNIPEVKEYIKIATNYSISGVLLVPPFYFKTLDDDGLFNYFSKILEASSLPIVLYNIPKYTGIPLSQTLIGQLTNYSQLIGIKDSSGDIGQTKRYLHAFPQLKIYSGSDALIYDSLQIGCHGVITALANAFPQAFHELIQLTSNKSLDKAKELQNWITTIRSITKQYPQIASIKYCMEKYLKLPPTFVRPPLINLNQQQKKKMIYSLDRIIMKS